MRVERRAGRRARLLLMLLLPAAGPPVVAQAATDPASVGMAEVVLPGFAPITVAGRQLTLGAGRTYDFATGLLPAATTALGEPLTGPLGLEFRRDGRVLRLSGGQLQVTAATGHHVELRGSAALDDTLTVETAIRVEFDGLATVDLTLRPTGRVALGGLTLTMPVARSPDTRLLAYDTESYALKKPEVHDPCRSSGYKNMLGFTDTVRTFWFLTDEPAFPVPTAGRPATELSCTADEILVRQPLLPTLTLDAPLTLRFAFLATPVKELSGSFRRDRVIPTATSGEEHLGNRLLWWVQAVPHYALPWVRYPPGARERLTAADQAAWPGLEANRRSVTDWRRMGVEQLPYMSLRAPSVLDPEVLANEALWRIHPALDTPSVGDGPYRQGFARPFFSHRAPGFSDYLVSRLDGVVAELPVRGFYFDQGPPIASGNPRHLTPDARIRPPSATDILAMRDFFKRLATAIHARGREPLVYVHNSFSTVIPAYTFVTALVQGEEFNARLKGLNYQDSVNYETLQATYLTAPTGIPVIWLEEVWSDYLARQRPARYRTDSAGWLKSAEYAALWRNFVSVALLHDAPLWTVAPQSLRRPLFWQLDDFGVARSTFRGYWQLDPGWRIRPILVSLWERADGKQLAVIVNRGQAARVFTAADLEPFLGAPLGRRAAKLLGQRVPPQDFVLAVL
ncbi:MAG: hypothetical protein KJ041_03180 [Gammaproteobacteria bacterium]|nr:hypothetical protein [Gammaproteobacteria bacterium]